MGLPPSVLQFTSKQPNQMSPYFSDYLSDLPSLSDADLSCLLCDAADFNDDAAFQVIVDEMRSRCI